MVTWKLRLHCSDYLANDLVLCLMNVMFSGNRASLSISLISELQREWPLKRDRNVSFAFMCGYFSRILNSRLLLCPYDSVIRFWKFTVGKVIFLYKN